MLLFKKSMVVLSTRTKDKTGAEKRRAKLWQLQCHTPEETAGER